jgi:quinol monooxygenase YgiN
MILWSRREFLAGAVGSVGVMAIGGDSVDRFGMFGKVTAQPGQRDVLVQHLLTAAKLVGDAPGCELYVVYTSPAEPDVIWVTEAWRSKADHDASLSLPGVKELIAKARPLIAQMGEPIITTPVGGKGLPAR